MYVLDEGFISKTTNSPFWKFRAGNQQADKVNTNEVTGTDQGQNQPMVSKKVTVRLPVFLSFFNWNTKLSNQLVRCKTSVVANWSLAYSCASCTLFVSIFSSLQLLRNFQLVPLKYDHFGFTALNLKAFKPYIADCSLQMTLLCRYYVFSFNPMTISIAVILHFITNGLSLVFFFFFFQAKADLVTTSTDVPEQNSPAVSQIKDRREW